MKNVFVFRGRTSENRLKEGGGLDCEIRNVVGQTKLMNFLLHLRNLLFAPRLHFKKPCTSERFHVPPKDKVQKKEKKSYACKEKHGSFT